MNAAKKIIEKFGGQSTLAALIEKGQSTVAYWAKTGVIPAKWRPHLLRIAIENSINLLPAEFDNLDVPIITETNELSLQKATHWGELVLGKEKIPCYVLENGERIFSLKGVVVALTGTDGGQLVEYIKVKSIREYLPPELIPAENGTVPALVNFDTGGASFAKNAVGVPVERFMDICIAYSTALQESNSGEAQVKLTERQTEIAIKANTFLRATAKVGIVALVDEATGYQYDRPIDALQFKLNLFLEKEMRDWEPTFPDDLWVQFGRLTNWKGGIHSRPKYWGKLVNELVYSYLDADVYEWLKKNQPKPRHGMNYHQWLSSQYGLKKLMEHLWQLIGMASACYSMSELRRKMAEKYGRVPVQMTLFVPAG
jgi:hypothetical protein